MNKRSCFIICLFSLLITLAASSQSLKDSLKVPADLEGCIRYALQHQQILQQSVLDEEIADAAIKSRLADWYPQISGTYTFQHYFQLPTAFIPDAGGNKVPVKSGLLNNSSVGIFVSQNIFSREVLLAARSAGDLLQQAREHTISNKIDVVVNVSKAFYDVLLTQRQVQVLDENMIRLQRSLQDAYNQYQGGIVDKIDYKRAQIALNNTTADRRRAAETIGAKLSVLKQQMGYPEQDNLEIVYDSLRLEKDIFTDTLATVQLNNRIEYQLLQTEQSLLASNLRYNRMSYLPAVSAIGSYSPYFANDRFAAIYNNVYPSSYIGLQLSIPVFQGGKRIQNIRSAELQLKRVQLDISLFEQQAGSQYAQALALYKGNLYELNALRENLVLAADVYNTLQLQYTAGIKTYLDVITAETDLRAAQLNYLNELFTVLSGKIDLEKALGRVHY